MLICAKEIDFYYVTTPEEVLEVAKILSNHSICGGDSEVYPLYEQYGERASWRDPHTSRFRLLQLNVPGNRTPWVIDRLKVGDEGMQPLVQQLMREDLIKVFHNSKYDHKVIRSTMGVWLPAVHCTMVMMQRLGICTGFKASQMRGHSLKAFARDFFDIELSKVEQSSDWSAEELTIDQLEYAALDVGAPRNSNLYSILLEGYFLLKEALESAPPSGYGVTTPLSLDLEANQVLARIEYSGMPVNADMLDALMRNARARLQECKLQMCQDLDLPVEQKIKFTTQGPQLEIVIPDKVSRLLNNPKALTIKINERMKVLLGFELSDAQSDTLEKVLTKLEADAKEIEGETSSNIQDEDDELDENFFLEECKEHIGVVGNILEYKTLLKLTGTDYSSLINPVTKCLHSNVNVLGASTGRMSSGGGSDTFNSQQLSKVELLIPAISNPFESKSEVF